MTWMCLLSFLFKNVCFLMRLPSLFPFTLSHIPLSTLLQILGLFFFISCCCLYVCICTYIYIPKNNLLKSCTVLLVCMFSGLTVWHWTINGCAPPRGGPLPAPSCPQLPIVLCVGLRPNGSIPIQFGMSIVSDLFGSRLGGHVGETLQA